MSRRRSYVADLVCEHNSTGYCISCWRAALVRGLTPAEWDQLHRQAADQMYPTYHAKPTRIPPPPKPAPCWNGTAVDVIGAKIRETIEDKDRPKIATWIGGGGSGYGIVATDGARMLAVPAVDPKRLSGAVEYLGTAMYPTWIPLPAGCDLVLRRVLTIYDSSTRHALVTCTWDGAELRLETKASWVGSAAEGIPVDGPSTPAEVCLDGRMLSDVLRGPIQLGIGTNCIMLRPADDSWRYVQMGFRA